MKILNRSKCHFGLILLYSLIIVVFLLGRIKNSERNRSTKECSKTCQALNMLCPKLQHLQIDIK